MGADTVIEGADADEDVACDIADDGGVAADPDGGGADDLVVENNLFPAALGRTATI